MFSETSLICRISHPLKMTWRTNRAIMCDGNRVFGIFPLLRIGKFWNEESGISITVSGNSDKYKRIVKYIRWFRELLWCILDALLKLWYLWRLGKCCPIEFLRNIEMSNTRWCQKLDKWKKYSSLFLYYINTTV